MSEREGRGDPDLAARFREALYAESSPGPARLELERRRLLARLDLASPARRAGRPGRVVAVWVGAALAAATAAAVTLALWPGEPAAVVEGVSLAGPWRVRPGDAVARGVPVRVPEGAGARLELPDGTILWLGPGTEVSARGGEASTFRVDAGRLLATVKPRPPGSELRVAAGDLEIAVRGTVFSVAAENGRSRLRLHSGRVEVRGGGQELGVEPGFEVELARSGTVTLRPVDAAGALADLLVAQRASDPAGPPIPHIAVPPEPAVRPAPEPPPPATAPATETRVPVAVRRPVGLRPPPLPADVPDASPAEPPPPADPELAGISVEAAPAQDDLYLRAIEQARTGDLEGSRRSLLDYLARFPEGRYWDRVRDILGE